MPPDERLTSSLFLDLINVLERHGYGRRDDQHTGQAIGVMRDLAHVYEGTRDASYGTYLSQAPSPSLEDPGAVLLTGTDVSTVLSALYVAAGDNCDRAETCADCGDQSCPMCQSRLQAARAYDDLTTQILRTTEARATPRDQPEPSHHRQPPADKEAAQ
jgi:hypothetical protein